MLEIFIGGIILFLVGVVQSALVTRIVLLNGMADLIMVVLIAWSLQKSVKYVSVWLLIGCGISALASELPFLGGTLAYACITTITILARNRFSEVSLLIMLIMTIVGTIIFHLISVTILIINGTFLPLAQVINLVTLPSIILNFLFAIPVYAVMRDLAHWLYPNLLDL